MRHEIAGLLAASAFALPGVSHGQEVSAGILAHGVNTPLTIDTGERGVDFQATVRFGGIEALSAIGRPAPYLIASVNSQGYTSFAGGGFAWTIGKGPVYLRPGIGLIIHDGPSYRYDSRRELRTDLGSRVLFEPELSLGYRINDRFAIEANWTHVSHAQLFSSNQNPGLDMIGARLVMKLK